MFNKYDLKNLHHVMDNQLHKHLVVQDAHIQKQSYHFQAPPLTCMPSASECTKLCDFALKWGKCRTCWLRQRQTFEKKS